MRKMASEQGHSRQEGGRSKAAEYVEKVSHRQRVKTAPTAKIFSGLSL